MICEKCVKFDGVVCRLDPEPISIDRPAQHWCSRGEWRSWSELYSEMEPFYWGEWEYVK